MKEKWFMAAKKADFIGIGQKYGIDPVTARIIRNRDVITDQDIHLYLHGTLKDIPSPWMLKDMEKAVGLLEKKINSHKKIRIIGDYDIDGVSSTHILLSAFTRLGAEVDTYIPDRVNDGYGLNIHLIEQAIEDGVDTIVTCDNGIAASQEILLAKDSGLTVIVTDHHEIPFEEKEGQKIYHLPVCDAIINPKQPDCPYPNKNICGAVVAWKMVFALYERMHVPYEEALDFLEFAAIATVGDVMDLLGENRIIVKEGLRKIKRTPNKGLQALIEANKLEDKELSAYHIGFVIGPCINASGRLDTASRALKLFQTKDREEAGKLAGDLTSLNQIRKDLTEKGKEEALTMLETTSFKNDRVLVIYLPKLHESLAGIIAGKIREKYNKPTFVLTKGNSAVKGSGRSIEGYSMYEELVRCADLLERFGGHPMAAGISLKEENVDLFRHRLNENCTLTEDDLALKIHFDVPVPITYVSRKLIRELDLIEPCGKANEKPLFAQKNLRVSGLRMIGKNRNACKMKLTDSSGITLEGIYFGEAENFFDFACSHEKINITYYPSINSYMGMESIQIVVRNYC